MTLPGLLPSGKVFYPIYDFLSYHRLSPSCFSFISALSSISTLKNVYKALDYLGWEHAIIVEMQALEYSGTWQLVPLPPGKQVVRCRWVYAIKVGPSGEVNHLKT